MANGFIRYHKCFLVIRITANSAQFDFRIFDIQNPSHLGICEKECRGYKGKYKLGEQISAIVEKRISEFTHAFGCPLSPDKHTCYEVADEAQENRKRQTEIYAEVAYLLVFAVFLLAQQTEILEESRKPQDGEGKQIVEEQTYYHSRPAFAVDEHVPLRNSLQKLKK